MCLALRYAISLGVGLIVTVLVLRFATTDHLVTISILPLYVVVTSMIIKHRKTWLSLSSDGTSPRKRGAIIGGLGAFTGSLLLQASIPAGVAGLGLLFLGTAGTIADFDE